MQRLARIGLLLAALLGVLGSGCADGSGPNFGTKQTIGAAGGAAAGAAAGYFIGGKSIWGALIGGAAGGLLGGYVGGQLDENDREQAAAAAERAMEGPVGQTQTWSNPQTGNSGAVRSTGERAQAGRTCRDFETSVRTGAGQTEAGRGTACQNPDGSWSII